MCRRIKLNLEADRILIKDQGAKAHLEASLQTKVFKLNKKLRLKGCRLDKLSKELKKKHNWIRMNKGKSQLKAKEYLRGKRMN